MDTTKKGNLYYAGFTGLTHADIAAFLQRTLTTQEQAIATGLIASLEVFIAKRCNRNFLLVAGSPLSDVVYTEVHDAGSFSIDLRNGPVKEVTKIELDGVVKYMLGSSSNSWSENVDFSVYEDHIEFDTLPISTKNNRRALKVYYTIDEFYGDDVKHAVKLWASQLLSSSTEGGRTITSVSHAGYSVNFSDEQVPEYVKQIINAYQNISIC